MLRPRDSTRISRACNALAFVLTRTGVGITSGGWWPWQSSAWLLSETGDDLVERVPKPAEPGQSL
ncbi:MAG: hypothetical protein IIA30_15120 [Myxococcales bacterium]|nr:hypothetical protein [Myxococcales bacterium]TDJ15866.1 MAG: hypothetical protein E2O69_11375 [Deltaproteobacteria bacterium]